ncbi:glycosyl hydrolase family 28-related protein [Kitasatospora sp. YST-16]|uniref:glycosyl hydrolase family 28-related protein n=1 Tax=Kitasatospora sp. YST-16 TaxID=2998080 RepID=UPI002284E66E|nr:glycosyl hydrolase family 28-related protein [Kitasatospora sp. YST-16]WAL70518.1 glycosyl hydrolase family 28-related protein [Kitasatospora sp. YST-16]WNW36558.1 glycosyl hydrolase family 28-related protein [Streptomyces sp. Li-HN-5-13]
MTAAPASPSRSALSRSARAGAVVVASVLGLGVALCAPAAQAAPASGGGGAAVTRAGIDPALTAGRGARVDFLEQEAEHAATTGSVIAADRTAYTLAAEASGRSAVKLAPGQYVEFTLPKDANAITVRYSLPDAADGGGTTAPLDVTVNGKDRRQLSATSQYSWLYNQYPFSNDPKAGLLHPDWWITECGCVPAATTPAPAIATPFRPGHMYDEQRLLLGRTYRAGDKVRIALPAGSKAPWAAIDLMDSQLVAAPHVELKAVNVLATGADPTGRRDSADAIDRAVRLAKALHLPVYLPPGVFQVNRHLVVDDVTVIGAGSWYTVLKGTQQTLATPAPDGSVHTGVGVYGKDAAQGGSHDVHLSGFAIEGDVRERIDTDQVNGIGGAFSDSSIEGLYIHHTKVGIWLDGPMKNLQITGNQIADQIADGINFHTGVADSVIRDNFLRNTGDDGIALWSEKTADARTVIDHNTVQSPTLANAIAVYGGTDTTVSDNLVADPVREGSGLHAGSRFGAEPFAGYLHFTDNTTVRAGTYELNWNIGLGAIWFEVLDRDIDADVRVTGDHYLDSTYNAIMAVAEWGVKDQYKLSNLAFKDVKIDGTGTSVLSARVAGSASFQNVTARNVGAVGINNCGTFHFTPAGSEFAVTDLGGNSGGGTTGDWLASWELPNTLTCDDRPPVVAPPAPSPW